MFEDNPMWQRKVNVNLTRVFSRLNIGGLLYTLLALLLICLIATYVSRIIMNKSLAQQKMAEHLMFEITYAHNFIVRDVDVTLRGFGIINDERYLYRSNEYISIDLENNFHRLDSLLISQNYSDPKGIEAIEKYKYYIRTFVNHHREMIQLIRDGKKSEFVNEFHKDSSASMWPIFTRAVEEVGKFERKLTNKAIADYRFFSIGVVYLQGFTLLLSVPLVMLILYRLKNERRTAKFLEERTLIDERNKIKENMLSMMSHEIRTPLNSMIGLTHALKSRSPREDQVEIINTLKTSGDHLLHLVNDILDYNKIQAKRLELEFISFNLVEILRQVHAMMVRSADEKGLKVTIQISTALPPKIIGDSTRLVQILSNLLSNAIKFTSEGSVTLNVRQAHQEHKLTMIEFKVEDTGIGISTDKLSLIFEPFAQMETHIHRKYGGTGLGLLIVKNLVELMGGKVEVKSVLGKGTSVIATIPFTVDTEEEDHQEAKRGSRFGELKGVRVLYAEDVESNRFLLNVLLEDHQMFCDNAKDGNEALTLAKEFKYDILLLDVQMPDMSGYEVAKRIRQDLSSKNNDTPIILFSAYTGISEDQIIECGANDFLGKPFLPEDLILKIEKQLKYPQVK
jgi:signal transduction histidine kinase/CheY-like chemotaxis protein